MKYKIVMKRADCIGCGACSAVCDNWEMNSDNKARPKQSTISEEELKCNKEAAEMCPVKCIQIKKTGK